MRRAFAILAVCLIGLSPAFALDVPSRKPGLWEIKMEFVGRKLPAQVMKQCIDAASDKMMNSTFGGSAQQACSKQDVHTVAGGMVVDSVCNYGGATTTSHAVMSGSFDSAYTVDVTSKRQTSKRQGGRPVPGMPADGESHMSIAAKWLGPCAAGQKPGDMIMANGMKINVLDMQRFQHGAPPRRP